MELSSAQDHFGGRIIYDTSVQINDWTSTAQGFIDKIP